MARALAFDLITRDKSFSKGLGQAEKKASGFQKTMGRVGAGVAGALAGGAILAGVKKVASAGSDLNETVNKTGLAFGKNAGQIQAWAQGSAKSMGLPKQAALEGASSFGLLFSKIGVGAGESAKMSQSMVQLAVDLGSVHNADPTAIIEAQTSAFRGEYDALQKFVPAINAAAVEQQALATTGKASAKTLTDGEKAAAVYAIMMKQTAKEQGDFARTANESANKTKINAARMKDLQANIGTLLLPALTAGTNALGDMADWVERNRGAATALGAAVAVVTGLVLANAAATKVKVAWDTAWAVGTKAVAAGQWLLNAALAANPIGLVVVAIAALAAGLIFAYKHSETFRRIVDGAFRSAATAGAFMWDKVLKPTFRFLVQTWLAVAGTIVHGAATAFGWVPGLGGKLKGAAKTFDTFAAEVNRNLNKISDENVNVTGTAKIDWTRFNASEKAHRKQYPFARGGIYEDHAAQIARGGGPVRVWAEPETGGEAYIPLAHSKRARSMAILREVADRFGASMAFARGGILPQVQGLGDTRGRVVGMGRQVGPRLGSSVGGSLGGNLNRVLAGYADRFAKAALKKFLAAGGGSAAIKAFIRSTDPLNYGWGGAGPVVYDCSGIVSAVHGKMRGLAGAGRGLRLYTTGSIRAGIHGLKSGLGGTLQIGVTPARGHMAGRYGGLGFEAESSRTGIKVGSAASSPESFARHFYLAKGGVIDAEMLERFARATNADIGGDQGRLRINGKVLDRGGWIYPGVNVVENRTGKPERVPDPGERFPTAREIGREVAKALAEQPLQAVALLDRQKVHRSMATEALWQDRR